MVDQVVNCFVTYQPGGCSAINPYLAFETIELTHTGIERTL